MTPIEQLRELIEEDVLRPLDSPLDEWMHEHGRHLLALVEAIEESTKGTDYPHYRLPLLNEWNVIIDALAKLKGDE